MNHKPDPISNNEKAFILRALETDSLRMDGRRPDQPRPLAIELGTEPGSVEVSMGKTKVAAAVTAELVEPFADRPSEGNLLFQVEFSPMADPAFEPGRPSEAAIELMRLLERAFRTSQSVDVEALCVVSCKHVWAIRCDLTAMDNFGNLTDAMVLAAAAGLRHMRLNAVAVQGVGDETTVRVMPAEEAALLPLAFHHTPVAVSVGLMPRPGGGGGVIAVVDPTDREEMVMRGALTAVVNQHQELCVLHKPGGIPVTAGEFSCAVAASTAHIPRVLTALEEALAAHAMRLDAAEAHLARTGRVAGRLPAATDEPPPPPISVEAPAAPLPTGSAAAPAPVPAPAPREADSDEEETVTVRSAFEASENASAAIAADSSSAAPPARAKSKPAKPAKKRKKA